MAVSKIGYSDLLADCCEFYTHHTYVDALCGGDLDKILENSFIPRKPTRRWQYFDDMFSRFDKTVISGMQFERRYNVTCKPKPT